MKLSVVIAFGLLSICTGFPPKVDTWNNILAIIVHDMDDVVSRMFYPRSGPVIFPPRRYPMTRGEIWTGPIGNINPEDGPFTYWSSNRGKGIVRIQDKNGRFYTLTFNRFRPPFVPFCRPTESPTKQPTMPTEPVTEPEDNNTEESEQPNVTDSTVTESDTSNTEISDQTNVTEPTVTESLVSKTQEPVTDAILDINKSNNAVEVTTKK